MAVAMSDLARWFGPESTGDNLCERARSSNRIFVRSVDQLAIWSDDASGHRLTAWEVFCTFGIEKLKEAVDEGVSVLTTNSSEPAASISHRRQQLGFDVDTLAHLAKLHTSVIQQAEDPKKISRIQDLERIFETLALDERLISVLPNAGEDAELGIRLRQQGDTSQWKPTTIALFAEIAWLVAAQSRLCKWLGIHAPDYGFSPNGNYGSAGYPAWRHGYYLAQETRKHLGIDPSEPIPSIRAICEENLNLPVVQAILPDAIAGATIANGGDRGIAVNVGGQRAVTIFRMTLAHELAHLLWDPDERLLRLRVDERDGVEADPRSRKDFVEQRANAFAVEFLAPQKGIANLIANPSEKASAVRLVMERYGIGVTPARYQIENTFDMHGAFANVHVSSIPEFYEFMAKEYGQTDVLPHEIPIQRAGVFAALVALASRENLINDDTALDYLGLTRSGLSKSKGIQLFRENAEIMAAFAPKRS